MGWERVPSPVRDASAFDDAEFVGLSRLSKRDPYRLGLFGQHLEPDEHPRALLAIQGGTLVVTDQRILEFRAHLEVHGAWNVKEFQGYEVRRSFPRNRVLQVDHTVSAPAGAPHVVEDALRLALPDREETVVVSRGPEATLLDADFEILRRAILGHAK